MAWSKNGNVVGALPYSEQNNDGSWYVLAGKAASTLAGRGWHEVPDEPIRQLDMDVPTFFMMFSAFEEAAIRDFAEAQPAQGEAAPITAGRKALKVMLSRIDKAQRINLALPQNQAGFDLLLSLGLLSNDRVQELKKGALV